MRVLLGIVLLVAVWCAPAAGLDITVNLVKAETGSWTRRLLPNGHAQTEYVVEAKGEGEAAVITLQLMMHHDGHPISNKVVVIPGSYIIQNGIGKGAKDGGNVEHKGDTFQVKVVDVPMDGATGRFYLSDAMPVNGIVKIDLVGADGRPSTTLWTDMYGSEPDEMIKNTEPGVNANDEYGIPKPSGK